MQTFGGYSLKKCVYREQGKGGGIVIYAKKDLKVISIADLNVFVEGRLEICFIELVTDDKDKHIAIGNIYRVPETNERIYI